MAESFIKDGHLVAEAEWIAHIENIEKECRIEDDPNPLKDAIVEAVRKRTSENACILFSGGVDSSLIAKISKDDGYDLPCICVGMAGSADLEAARNAAKKHDLRLVAKEYALKEIGDIIKRTVAILHGNTEVNAVSVGVGSVVLAGMDIAKELGQTSVLSGLGSEEIFAGYERHMAAEDVHAECFRGLKGMWKRDLERDAAISEAMGICVLTPFLDEKVIRIAMSIPPQKKIDDSYKKIALRQTAEELGLASEIAWRKKKAAQYGSSFDKALGKIARRSGYRYKREYLDHLGL